MDDKVIVLVSLLAPAVILGSIALFRGYAIKVWRDEKDDPDHRGLGDHTNRDGP